MAGYYVAGSCYTSSSDAVSAYYSSIPPSISFNPDLHIFQYLPSSSSWKLFHFHISSDGTTNQSIIPVSSNVFTIGSDCYISQPGQFFSDGLSLGWSIAAACIGAWAIWIIRRGL